VKTGSGIHRFGLGFLSTGVVLLATAPALAADSEVTAMQLDEITVTSTRIEDEQARLPIAVGTVGEDEIQLGRQQLGLDESMVNIPGLFFQNRYNFAQDLRISIRGFGARASFGIRGIRIYADGIPQTLPDGQSSVDAIDLGSSRRIEVIRGPGSSVYGAASGGVINIMTEDGPETPYMSGRINTGSYGFAQGQLKAGGQAGHLNYLVNGSGTILDGYRRHSSYRSALLNSKFHYDLDDSSHLTVVLNAVDSPKAEDPGALTESEVEGDRKQAAPRNLLFDAGEELDQQTIGLAYNKAFGTKHQLMLRNYTVMRDFRNRLPFAINSNGQGGSVRLDRFFLGGGGNYTYSGDLLDKANRLVLGFDIDAQRDHRKRFANNEGVLGDKTTDQDEDVTSYGVYFQDALQMSENVTLTLGSRYDNVRYDVDDHTAGNGSGNTSFDELSPMVGVVWTINPAVNLYGNIARSFDPPTTTELANPMGASGFNPNLKPQTATNYEIGVKGLLPGRIRYEIALFHIKVDDELVRFELTGSGQSFFENAGSSTHQGLESAMSMELLPGLTGSLTHTYSDFTFDSFRDRSGNNFDGNKIPGVPDNAFHIELSYQHPAGFYASWDLRHADSFYADNANTVKSGAYSVANLRAGTIKNWNQWEISPFIGINNLFAEDYFDNIRLNASFGRYFEPAPKRNFYGGIGIRYNFD
jgi:iron complex outermembrane receptor protein